MNQANFWIDKLQLKPHPEGGYYNETYRSDFYISEDNLAHTHGGKRRSGTLIYFLLKDEDVSKFHRLKSDEIWIYQLGVSIIIHIILPNGELQSVILGKDIERGEKLQVVVPANSWFAAELSSEHSFSLLSCMVTPGFIFNDFELAKQEQLLKEYPQYSYLIINLSSR